jgi:outer membrane autotransporter protein
LVKADFLTIDFDIEGDDDTADAWAYGFRIEGGQRFHLGDGAFVEPKASLAYSRTVVDSVELMGADVSFDDAESLQGTIGMRLGTRLVTGGLTLVPFASLDAGYEFLGDSGSTVSSGGASFGSDDDLGGAFGELGLGVTLLDLGQGRGAVPRRGIL